MRVTLIVYFFVMLTCQLASPSLSAQQNNTSKEYIIYHLADSIDKLTLKTRIDSTLINDRNGFLIGKFFDTIFYNNFNKPVKFITARIVLNSQNEPRLNKYTCYFFPNEYNYVIYQPLTASTSLLPSTLLFFDRGKLFKLRGVYKEQRKADEEEALLHSLKKRFGFL